MDPFGPSTVFLGVARLRLSVPGARSLKDRRRVVVALKDRYRTRHHVSCHEVTGHDRPGEAILLVTTGGLEASPVRSALDTIVAHAGAHPRCVLIDATVEVRGWPDPIPWQDDADEGVIMSELERRRDARELWVSRSHLHAAVVFAMLFGVFCFGLGYLLGHGRTVVVEAPRSATLVDEVPGDELMELLAEVERSRIAYTSAAVEYPDWARGAPMRVPAAEDAPTPAPVTASVGAPPDPSGAGVVDAAPAVDAAFTVQLGPFATPGDVAAVRDHLRGAGLDVRATVVRVDGEAQTVVQVGAYDDAETAEADVAAVAEALQGAPVPSGSPEVVPGVR